MSDVGRPLAMAPAVYLRNRLVAASAWALESLARHQTPSYEKQARLRTPSRRWEPSALALSPVQHEELPGLWLLRQAVEPAGVEALRALVGATMLPPRPRAAHDEAEAAAREAQLLLEQAAKLPAGSEWAIEASEQAGVAVTRRDRLRAAADALPLPRPPMRSSRQWEWHPFENGRLMAPMLAHPDNGGGVSFESQQRLLGDFEVFGGPPVEQWLRLEELADSDNLRQRDGAERALRLQRELPELLPCLSTLSQPRCLFHQWQLLERGAAVAPHVDAPTPPADVVATLELGPGRRRDSVRVGSASFGLEAGDVYAISGPARWDVTHEVLSSTSDRLSLTLRFSSSGALEEAKH